MLVVMVARTVRALRSQGIVPYLALGTLLGSAYAFGVTPEHTQNNSNTAATPTKKTLAQFTVDALVETAGELNLGPKEKHYFDSEAQGPDAQDFASNYRNEGAITRVQIDKDKLVNYLRFDASRFAPPAMNGVCVVVRAQPDCASCVAVREAVSATLIQRLENRGFKATTGQPFADDFTLWGNGAFDDLVAREVELHCDGVVYGELGTEHSSDEDDEGDDIQVRWNARAALSDLAAKRVKAQASASVQVPRALEGQALIQQLAQTFVARGAGDLYAQLAARSTPMAALAGLSGADEHYLRLEGVTSFGAYVKFKQIVSQNLPELNLEERFISPGVFEFKVAPEVDLVQAAEKIKKLSWGEQTLDVLRASPAETVVGFR